MRIFAICIVHFLSAIFIVSCGSNDNPGEQPTNTQPDPGPVDPPVVTPTTYPLTVNVDIPQQVIDSGLMSDSQFAVEMTYKEDNSNTLIAVGHKDSDTSYAIAVDSTFTSITIDKIFIRVVQNTSDCNFATNTLNTTLDISSNNTLHISQGFEITDRNRNGYTELREAVYGFCNGAVPPGILPNDFDDSSLSMGMTDATTMSISWRAPKIGSTDFSYQVFNADVDNLTSYAEVVAGAQLFADWQSALQVNVANVASLAQKYWYVFAKDTVGLIQPYQVAKTLSAALDSSVNGQGWMEVAYDDVVRLGNYFYFVDNYIDTKTSTYKLHLSRHNANLEADAATTLTLDTGSIGNSRVGIIADANARLLVFVATKGIGIPSPAGNLRFIAIYRLDANLQLDTTFGSNGLANIDVSNYPDLDLDAAVQGKPVVTVDSGGNIYAAVSVAKSLFPHPIAMLIWKVNDSGKIDGTFANNGAFFFQGKDPSYSYSYVNDMVADASANLYIAGQTEATTQSGTSVSGFVLFKLAPDGNYDTSYADQGILASVNLNANYYTRKAAHIQLDKAGGVLAFASVNSSTSSERILLRIASDGKVDTNFKISKYDHEASNIAIDAAGKIVIATQGRLSNDFRLLRLNDDGSVDTSFTPLGYVDHGLYPVGSLNYIRPEKVFIATDLSISAFAQISTPAMVDALSFGWKFWP